MESIMKTPLTIFNPLMFAKDLQQNHRYSFDWSLFKISKCC